MVRPHWTDLPSGGHFLVWEVPQLVTQDVITFFADYRQQSLRHGRHASSPWRPKPSPADSKTAADSPGVKFYLRTVLLLGVPFPGGTVVRS